MTTSLGRLRLGPAEATYVGAVLVGAGVGLGTGSAPVILIAALVSLPSSIVALPAYYLAYGLLALVPGPNPASATGSGSCTPAGDCVTVTTGTIPGWFTVTTDIVGVVALLAAALLNVVLLRRVSAVRRARRTPPGP